MGISLDNIVVTPRTTFQTKLFTQRTASGEDAVQSIAVKVASAELMDEARDEIETILRRRHRIATDEKNDFAIISMEQMLGLLGLQPGAAIVDLGCGPGRHSLELARRGFEVTGVDRTGTFIQKARVQAKEEGLSAEFVESDIREFCRPEAFDAAISLFTSFGYFEDASDNRQIVLNAHRSLKDGGALLIDVKGKECLARVFRERDWQEHEGRFFLQERSVHKNWTWMENRWILIEGRERHEFRISHWLYSASELCKLMGECGFGSLAVFGSLDGAPYDHMADRLVVVARKSR